MTQSWQPYREPFRVTLLRTGIIALVLGMAFSLSRGGLARWPSATLLALWPSFGGHWVEIAYLNWLRPRLPGSRAVQVLARITVWFIGGILLAAGMQWTAMHLPGFRQLRGIPWWIGGIAFIIIELTAHLGLQIRHRPNFYNGQG